MRAAMRAAALRRLLVPLLALAALCAFAPVVGAQTAAFQVVSGQSSLTFSVKSPIGGLTAGMEFASGRIVVGPQGQILSAQIAVDATSLAAAGFVRRRLSGKAGFHLEAHPQIAFRATRVTQRGGEIAIDGDLTIKGTTQPARFTGTARGPQGGRLSLNVSATVDRTAYGITAGRPLYSRNATVAIALVAQRAGA